VLRILFPLLLGVSGVVVLVALGFWQLDRLVWKEAVLADIDARIAAEPVAISINPDEAIDEYSAVTFSGIPGDVELHVLTSGTAAGTGYRVIRAFILADGRRILIDLGLLPLDAKSETLPVMQGSVDVVGNLIWPDDMHDATPEPDIAKNIWFGRDLVNMARVLDTLPLMVVAAQMSTPPPHTTLLPVNTENIKNDHLSYAVTWFGLAIVWAAMTLFLISRILRAKDTE
jgi:surfeit locus 1 family protein